MVTDIDALAYVKRMTRKIVRLGIFESVESLNVTEDTITLVVNRAVANESRGNFRVTKRGVTIYVWKRTVLDGWIPNKPITAWYDADEYFSAYPGLSPREHAEKSKWEAMCANPGRKFW